MNVFIAYSTQKNYIDIIQNSGDEALIRQKSQSIEKAYEIWRSWVILSGGDLVANMGYYGIIAVDGEHLDDLVKIKEQYEEAVDFQVSVGVGLNLQEADKALTVAINNCFGGIVFYTPEIETELAEINGETEENPLDFLNKAEHPLQAEFQKLVDQQNQPAPVEDKTNQIKAEVVAILQQVRANANELESIKATAPHLHDSIVKLTQGLIMIARELKTQNPPGQNSAEPIQKSFKMDYPINFILSPNGNRKGGRIKSVTKDGKASWHSVRSGIVMNQTTGAAVSSREPNAGTPKEEA
jgi:hypothetical protein